MGPVWAVGLMTGTVLDGMIDIAALYTDGEQVSAFGPWTLAPYPSPVRPLLVEALSLCAALAVRWLRAGSFSPRREAALTRAQSAAVLDFLASNGIASSNVAVIGFHGQTVLHRPPSPGVPGRTRQLGDGGLMAALTGIDVVYDFRNADMTAGGQGAPLAAAYHGALLQRSMGTDAIINLGGVGNLTWRSEDGELTAFDTGPANAPLNDWVERATGYRMDRDGALAGAGESGRGSATPASGTSVFHQALPEIPGSVRFRC